MTTDAELADRLELIASEGPMIHCLSWSVIQVACQEAATKLRALAPIPPTQGDAIGEGPWWYCQGSGSDLCGAKNYHDEKVCWKCHRPKLAPSPNAQSELVERLQEDAEIAASVLNFMGGDDNDACAAELLARVKEVSASITELEQRNRELEQELRNKNAV